MKTSRRSALDRTLWRTRGLKKEQHRKSASQIARQRSALEADSYETLLKGQSVNKGRHDWAIVF